MARRHGGHSARMFNLVRCTLRTTENEYTNKFPLKLPTTIKLY